MTRVLSEFLSAAEPSFRLGLRHLEQVNGRPNHDIRLTTELLQQTKDKLRMVGLDPRDTTGAELYHSLQQRVADDDRRLERSLRSRAASAVSAEANLMSGMVHALQTVPDTQRCFAIKNGVLRTLLKKTPPKKTLKQLGYRSFDSMLKHESPAAVLSAAHLLESVTWQRNFTDQYKQLTATDFESRLVQVVSPSSASWQRLAQKVVSQQQHTMVSLREVGSILLLPLPITKPQGAVIATMALAIHELNEIQVSTTFLQLAQVQPDFGKQVMMVARAQPHLQTSLLDQVVPWHMLQRFYSRFEGSAEDGLFEPYLQASDFSWQAVEDVLAQIDPRLEFWQGSAHLGLLDHGKAVSCNLIDNALSCCNKLAYGERRVQRAQQALLSELSLRYLQHETLSAAVHAGIQPQLAYEPVIG